MECFSCYEETNPTLVYCQHCGVPLDTDIEDIVADELKKERAAKELAALLRNKKALHAVPKRRHDRHIRIGIIIH